MMLQVWYIYLPKLADFGVNAEKHPMEHMGIGQIETGKFGKPLCFFMRPWV